MGEETSDNAGQHRTPRRSGSEASTPGTGADPFPQEAPRSRLPPTSVRKRVLRPVPAARDPQRTLSVLLCSPRTVRSQLWESLLPADIRVTAGQAPRQRLPPSRGRPPARTAPGLPQAFPRRRLRPAANEHLHIRHDNLLCSSLVGPEVSLVHLLLVIKHPSCLSITEEQQRRQQTARRELQSTSRRGG